MQDENIKALPRAQAIATGCNFLISASTGNPLLTVEPGRSVGEALRISTRILDGLSCLLQRVTDDPDDTLGPTELFAVRVTLETAASINLACRRGLEAEESEV